MNSSLETRMSKSRVAEKSRSIDCVNDHSRPHMDNPKRANMLSAHAPRWNATVTLRSALLLRSGLSLSVAVEDLLSSFQEVPVGRQRSCFYSIASFACLVSTDHYEAVYSSSCFAGLCDVIFLPCFTLGSRLCASDCWFEQ